MEWDWGAWVVRWGETCVFFCVCEGDWAVCAFRSFWSLSFFMILCVSCVAVVVEVSPLGEGAILRLFSVASALSPSPDPDISIPSAPFSDTAARRSATLIAEVGVFSSSILSSVRWVGIFGRGV